MKSPQWLQLFRRDNFSFFLPVLFYKVAGYSMLPAIHEKDIVVIVNRHLINPKVGEIIIFNKNKKIMIKRIIGKSNKLIRVEGDNNLHSLDSRHFGEIQIKKVIGKVILTLHPHQ